MKPSVLLSAFGCLLALAFTASAQPESLVSVKEGRYGWGADEARSIAVLGDGVIVFTGISDPPKRSGKDILFGSLTPDLIQRGELVTIGRSGDDFGYQIIPDWDGNLLIAGSSDKPAYGARKAVLQRYTGKKDAWLLKVQPNGTVIWDKLMGSVEDDEWLSVDIDARGHYYLAGYKAGHTWIVKLDRTGNVLWEKVYPYGDQSTATRVRVLQNGDVVLAGYLQKKGRLDDALVLRLDAANGRVIWEKTYTNARVADVIENPDGSLALTGMQYAQPEREQVLLLMVGKDGIEKWRKDYGDIGPDEGKSILRGWDGSYLIVGDNSSYGKMARRRSLWMLKVNAKGEALSAEPLLFGGKMEDRGFGIVQDNDGSLLMSGMATSLADGTEAWVKKFSDNQLRTPSYSSDMAVQPLGFFDENSDEKLHPGEKGYFLFAVTNQDLLLPTKRLMVKIPPAGSGFSFQYANQIDIGVIPPGTKKYFSVPVTAGTEARGGETALQFRLVDKSQVEEYAQFAAALLTKPPLTPSLQLAGSQFFANGTPVTQLEKEQTIELQMRILNVGEAPATDIGARFNWPSWVELLAPPSNLPADLNPGESAPVSLSFQLSSAYNAGAFDLTGLIGCMTCPDSLTSRWNLPVAIRQTVAAPKVEVFLEWMSPDPFEHANSEMTSRLDKIEIKVRMLSNVPIAESDVRVYINDVEVGVGEKFDVAQLSALMRDKANPMQAYQYRNDISLREGANRIEIGVKTKNGEVRSRPFVVSYAGAKPDLHLLAIGVPAPDLRYTGQDARDFAKAFKAQEGKLFNKVNTYLHISEDSTTVTSLRRSFELMRSQFRRQIAEDDVLIVYISSHGKTNSEMNGFLIPCSDYDDATPSSTSLDFQANVLDQLAKVDCQKFLFIDACHSGSALDDFADSGVKGMEDEEESVLSEALDRLLQNRGMHIITSCSTKEKSYELEALQNSAFTEAIIEAFGGQPVSLTTKKLLSPNPDGDEFLTFQELYEFVQARVPDLVLKYKGKDDKQTPTVTSKDLEGNLPLFYLKK